MGSPNAADFAALARSSPWRFSTLTFTLRWQQSVHRFGAVRGYLRRPDLLRVETVGGELIQVVQQSPRSGMTGGAEFRAEFRGPTSEQPSDMTPPPIGPGLAPVPAPRPGRAIGFDGEPAPMFRPDGLVARRPEAESVGDFDAPMFENYYWTALLDPVELADGRDATTGLRHEGTVIHDVVEVDHFGRPAWQATVRPGNAYAPRCGDCSLMRDRRVDLGEFGADADSRYFLAEYPTGYQVRLDVGTGVCVRIEALDGSNAGEGHEVVIEGVNADLPDDLFTE